MDRHTKAELGIRTRGECVDFVRGPFCTLYVGAMGMNWRYRGPILTVEHAVQAHRRIRITCQGAGCGRERTMSAFKLYMASIKTLPLPLGKPVGPFRCKVCRRRVKVVIVALESRAG